MVTEDRRVIVQGVYELFEKETSTEWAGEPRVNRLVFIGTVHTHTHAQTHAHTHTHTHTHTHAHAHTHTHARTHTHCLL